MLEKINLRFTIILLFILLAVATRLLPHWPNVTAVGAMALFGAAQFRQLRWAIAIPFIALFLSDLYLNNVVYGIYYDGFVWMTSIWIYLGFAAMLGVGYLLRGRVRVKNIVLATLSGSFLFFLVTNAGAWLADPIYPKNAAGLLASYTAGLPFFWNSLLGNLFYCAVFFGSFAWLESRYLRTQTA